MLRRLLIAPIRFYQRWISPMTPPSCRHTPTCSNYAVQAIEWWGLRGVWMAACRVGRCHPWHPGGYDPVPRPPWLEPPPTDDQAPCGCAHGAHEPQD